MLFNPFNILQLRRRKAAASIYTRRERVAHGRKAAAVAGARGKSARPLTAQQLMLRYFMQNGCEKLTPAQARRIRHKHEYAS